MLDGRHGVLLGYSGGADSCALLDLLHSYCSSAGIYLKAVHIHHGIRGDEADRDAEHCRLSCDKLNIDFELVRADIPALAKESGRGIEETARDFRYETFARILDSDDRLDCVAVAHNADDNAETLIFNIARGAGIDGLSGIPPIRKLACKNAIRDIVRPLIYCSKRDILGYCSENSIQYIIDSTNNDTAYTRNFIRHEILPRLKELNPSFLGAAERLSSQARTDSEYLDYLADEFLLSNGNEISVSKLADTARPISSRVIIKLFTKVSDTALEAVHINAILSLVRSAREGSSLSLPDRITAKIEHGKLNFTHEAKPQKIEFYHELKIGVNQFTSPDFAVLILPNIQKTENFEKYNEYLKNIYKLSIHTRLNSDKINHILYVRSRCDGDSYVYGGMTRKIKKLYNDRGLDVDMRKTLPIFCDDNGIVWIPGFSPADRIAANNVHDEHLLDVYYYSN
ncbi:MAG: tRNA lysidine(34) synthetase TilS [Clostridiales bacterium]|nr:tRNA lysidine(34) synthetase TilS [Clostridiales bacterium]